jgi:hypothetical protein
LVRLGAVFAADACAAVHMNNAIQDKSMSAAVVNFFMIYPGIILYF